MSVSAGAITYTPAAVAPPNVAKFFCAPSAYAAQPPSRAKSSALEQLGTALRQLETIRGREFWDQVAARLRGRLDSRAAFAAVLDEMGAVPLLHDWIGALADHPQFRQFALLAAAASDRPFLAEELNRKMHWVIQPQIEEHTRHLDAAERQAWRDPVIERLGYTPLPELTQRQWDTESTWIVAGMKTPEQIALREAARGRHYLALGDPAARLLLGAPLTTRFPDAIFWDPAARTFEVVEAKSSLGPDRIEHAAEQMANGLRYLRAFVAARKIANVRYRTILVTPRGAELPRSRYHVDGDAVYRIDATERERIAGLPIELRFY